MGVYACLHFSAKRADESSFSATLKIAQLNLFVKFISIFVYVSIWIFKNSCFFSKSRQNVHKLPTLIIICCHYYFGVAIIAIPILLRRSKNFGRNFINSLSFVSCFICKMICTLYLLYVECVYFILWHIQSV